MRIRYIAFMRLPTERAHGIQIMQMCAAFVRAGAQVELIVTARGIEGEDPFAYYGISERFEVKRIEAPDMPKLGKLGVFLPYLLFSWRAARYVRRTIQAGDMPYARDPVQVWLLGNELSTRSIWETHTGNTWYLVRYCARSLRSRMVAITQGARDFWVQQGIASDRFLIAPDGFDPREFAGMPTREIARKELGIPQDRRIVLYTGHLYGWKGATTLAKAASFLPEDALVFFVGGIEKDIGSFKRQFGDDPRVRIIGHRPHTEIPRWLAAADILVLPNSGTSDISRLYTSPLKLFEYMAADRPIVASDLPSIREILSEDLAYLARPDDAEDLARVIRRSLQDVQGSLARARRAYDVVQQYSWDARAKRILDMMQKKA